jgi:hypothetical protein
MYTSVAWLALAGFFNGPAAPSYRTEPVWMKDYSAAQMAGKAQKRPVAVFIGSGGKGYEKLVQDGPLNSETRKVLQENYICVHLDTSNSKAKELASVLAITQSQGLVVSDRSGQYQAFHCNGSIPQEELLGKLIQVAQAEEGVQTTDVYPPPPPPPAPRYVAPAPAMRANC